MSGARPAISIGKLIGAAPRLRALCADADRLGRLETWLLAQLDVALRPHCRLAPDQRRPGTLVLTVDSAAWATRVRFLLPQLQQRLLARPEAESARALDVKVRLAGAAPPSRPSRPARLPTEAAAALRATAATIDHPALSAALLRLSRRSR